MDEMDGRLTEDAYHFMLKSAKDSGYNTLRVWGGGLYYHDIVYDTADEMGLLMYHDAMYGQVNALPHALRHGVCLLIVVRRGVRSPAMVRWKLGSGNRQQDAGC
jgi:beta-galactosidase/beta-glucuronidase